MGPVPKDPPPGKSLFPISEAPPSPNLLGSNPSETLPLILGNPVN